MSSPKTLVSPDPTERVGDGKADGRARIMPTPVAPRRGRRDGPPEARWLRPAPSRPLSRSEHPQEDRRSCGLAAALLADGSRHRVQVPAGSFTVLPVWVAQSSSGAPRCAAGSGTQLLVCPGSQGFWLGSGAARRPVEATSPTLNQSQQAQVRLERSGS